MRIHGVRVSRVLALLRPWRPSGGDPPPEPADLDIPEGALAVDGRALLFDSRFLVVE